VIGGASLKPHPVAAEVVMDRRGKGERFVVINDDFHKDKGKHRDQDDDKGKGKDKKEKTKGTERARKIN
jgi:hypothetical protein